MCQEPIQFYNDFAIVMVGHVIQTVTLCALSYEHPAGLLITLYIVYMIILKSEGYVVMMAYALALETSHVTPDYLYLRVNPPPPI